MIMPCFEGPGAWRSLARRGAARLRRVARALLGLGNGPRGPEPHPAVLVRGARSALTARWRQRMARQIARALRTPRLPPPECAGRDREGGA